MITSSSNSDVKEIRRLRRERGRFALLEGPHLVAEAGVLGLQMRIFATPAFMESEDGRGLSWLWTRAEPRVIEEKILRGLCESQNPRGIMAIVELPRAGLDGLAVDSYPAAGNKDLDYDLPNGLYVWVDGVQDPGNLGALSRVCESVGAEALCLTSGCCHPNHPRALRASAGSLLRIRLAREVEIDAFDQCFPASRRPYWFALSPRGGKVLFDRSRPLDRVSVIALGGEGAGLSPAVLERADEQITIPLEGKVESLNLVVAAAIALFHFKKP